MEYEGVLLGQCLGNYRMVRYIGRGSMGEVFEGEHVLLGRKAAVKVLLREMATTPETVSRFLQEARAAAKLRHAGLTEVFDFGTNEGGNAFIVMELLDGANLAEVVERGGKLTASDTIRLGRQIATAMAFAHASGVVHRDLKPENIVLIPDQDVAGGRRVKVLDFGLAKLVTASLAGNGPSFTREGQIMGTPAFMAPEQCHGASRVDERADIYSLGCVLYFMLTGQPPFVSEGVGATIAAHLYEQPTAPAKLVPSIPVRLDALIMRLLEKSADQRPGSMDEVEELLAGIERPMARGTPTTFSPALSDTMLSMNAPAPRSSATPGAGEPPRSTIDLASAVVANPPSRHKVRWLAFGGLALVLVAGVGLALRDRPVDRPSTPQPPPVATPEPHPVVPAPVVEAGRPATITVIVTSRPDGAEVIRVADGAVLGQTPLSLELPSAEGTLELRIDKPGFASETLQLPAGRDGQAQVVLEKRPAAGRARASGPERTRATTLAPTPASSQVTPVPAPVPVNDPGPTPPPKKSVKDGALDPFGD